MSLAPYKAEVEAGLATAIQQQNSVAFNLRDIKEVDPSEEMVNLAAANIQDDLQRDLFYFDSILVTASDEAKSEQDSLALLGFNGNDDFFYTEETYKAKDTPVDKPVDFMHDQSIIIGHMIKSKVVDIEGNTISDDTALDNLPDNFDIVVSSVLYKVRPELKHPFEVDEIITMSELISGIKDGDWMVSMECIFTDFDYIVDGKIVKRDAATAEMTASLRAYGGNGVYNGSRIGRVLRNFFFIGKGIVDNPANKRSFITKTEAQKDNIETQILVNMGENEMAEANNTSQEVEILKAQVKDLTSKLEKSEAKNEELAKAEIAKVEAELNSKIESLESQLEAAKKAAEEDKDKMKKMEEEKAQYKEDKEKKEEEAKKAKSELEEIKAEQVKSARVAKLVEAGLEKAEALKTFDKWSSASDEQFEDIVKLHTKASETVETEETTEASETELDNVEENAQASLTTPDTSDDMAEIIKLAAAGLSKACKYKDENKGDE